MVKRSARDVCVFCRHFASSSRRTYSSEARSRDLSSQEFAARDAHNQFPPQVSELIQHQSNLQNPVSTIRELLKPIIALRTPQTKFKHPVATDLLKDAVREALDAQNAATPKLTGDETSASDTTIPIESLHLSGHQVHQIGAKAVRKLIRAQLYQARDPRDILRILATAMQRPPLAKQFARMGSDIVRAMFLLRETNTDTRILSLLNIIITRLERPTFPSHKQVDLQIDPLLVKNAILFAARCRSLQAMKRHLLRLRRMGVGMDTRLFHAIVAKFSIGYRGLGEIRNGRWKRDDLLQVLLGFKSEVDKDLPPHHLGSFIVREDWDCLQAWVAILARCKAKDEVWKEWELWRDSKERLADAPPSSRETTSARPQTSSAGQNEDSPSASPSEYDLQSLAETTSTGGRQTLYDLERGFGRSKFSKLASPKLRGDIWFIFHLILASAPKYAWQAFEQSGINFNELPPYIQTRLVEHPEFATRWSPDMEAPVLAMYERKLAHLEQELGLQWVSLDEPSRPTPHRQSEGDSSVGYHVLALPAEEMLEQLQQNKPKRERGFFVDGIEDEGESRNPQSTFVCLLPHWDQLTDTRPVDWIDDDLTILHEAPPPYDPPAS
jgi:hypothetical protein